MSTKEKRPVNLNLLIEPFGSGGVRVSVVGSKGQVTYPVEAMNLTDATRCIFDLMRKRFALLNGIPGDLINREGLDEHAWLSAILGNEDLVLLEPDTIMPEPPHTP